MIITFLWLINITKDRADVGDRFRLSPLSILHKPILWVQENAGDDGAKWTRGLGYQFNGKSAKQRGMWGLLQDKARV